MERRPERANVESQVLELTLDRVAPLDRRPFELQRALVGRGARRDPVCRVAADGREVDGERAQRSECVAPHPAANIFHAADPCGIPVLADRELGEHPEGHVRAGVLVDLFGQKLALGGRVLGQVDRRCVLVDRHQHRRITATRARQSGGRSDQLPGQTTKAYSRLGRRNALHLNRAPAVRTMTAMLRAMVMLTLVAWTGSAGADPIIQLAVERDNLLPLIEQPASIVVQPRTEAARVADQRDSRVWQAIDVAALVASTAALAADWQTTRRFAQQGWMMGGYIFEEQNPIMGARPGARSVDLYFAATAALNALAWHLTPPKWRTVLPLAVTAVSIERAVRNTAIAHGHVCGQSWC